MKKIFKLLTIALVLFCFTNVYADSRDDKNTKTPVIIQGTTFYAGVEVYFNNQTRTAFIGDIDIYYDETSNTIVAKVKRSQINNIIESTDSDVYLNVELNIDYHNYAKDEYTIYSNEDGSIYWINENGKDSKNSYIEFLSTSVEIYGGLSYTSVSPGVHALFKGNFFDINDYGENHYAEEFSDQVRKALVNNINYKFSIDEDVKADMKNITSIDVGVTDENSVYKENIDINNFYQLVDNNKTVIMSLLMYDKDGKPIEIKDEDINMKIDESQNLEEIKKYFSKKDGKNIQILTFNYKYEFDGKAKIRTYTKNKFKDSDLLNVYYYNEKDNKMELIDRDLTIDNNGYLTFEVEHFSEYVITTSNNKVLKEKLVVSKDKKEESKFIPIFIGIIALIIPIISILMTKRKAK